MRMRGMSEWDPADIVAHLPSLRSYARALTRDPVDADDLVQDALLRAYERAATYRRDHPLKSWLLTIVHNLFIDRRRREGSELRRNARLSQLYDGAVAPAGQEQAVQLREVAQRFDALPEEHRAVLSLIAVQGLSYQETAMTLEVPVGTVMSRLHRARAALREPYAVDGVRLHVVGGKDAS